MLFKNILDQKTQTLQPEFDKLFADTFNNQTHGGDLLLIQANGFYDPEVHNWNNGAVKSSPYVIGPGNEGHSEYLHHDFIGRYTKTAITDQPFEEYQRLCEFSPERKKEIDDLVDNETYVVQNEMLIYLKIWEGDSFIKKFYQLARLNNGLEYDWHFSIAESNRDKSATGTRDSIIRKEIRDRFKENYPAIYMAMQNAHKSQVRNSIAHSQYAIFGRYIHLNNAIKNDKYSQIEVVSFDEWIDMMHDTLVIYTQQTRLLNRIDALYEDVSSRNNSLIEIRLHRKDPVDCTEYRMLKQRVPVHGWYWASNDSTNH